MSVRRAEWGNVILALAMLAVIGAGIQRWSVHDATGDWDFWPHAVPSKVSFAGRHFDCMPEQTLWGETVDGLSLRGLTAGGGEIYSSSAEATTTIRVKTSDGVYTCSLMGGL
ncbi:MULTISPECIES: hypothetical protein [unclassified Cryobacterium]|uniref:hypothetical protein n=1 Tax=unclassified Cryobacterium TaxID=2649013 RepID=UPI002AB4FC48|nr:MULTISPECIES: hypothetical protein [unclassified Cryobacterium]MDY7529907.1 hypothetical protein [Cryobacterium sp. 10C2]MEB0202606.1 hypothetical protein [Cryobacterium sp. 5I3]